jgi:hypothetical protein
MRIDCNGLSRFERSADDNNHLYDASNLNATSFAFSWFDALDAVQDLNRCCDKPPHLASVTSLQENAFEATVIPAASLRGAFDLKNLSWTNLLTFVRDGATEVFDCSN